MKFERARVLSEAAEMDTVNWFVQQLNSTIQEGPLIDARYYNTFDYTRTGSNICHPRTVGLIARICWTIPDVAAVDIDIHYNLSREVKFQPQYLQLLLYHLFLLILFLSREGFYLLLEQYYL